MILIFVLTIFFVAANAATDEELWTEFKRDHGKTYKSLAEEKTRFSIFKSTLREIEEHNTKYNNGEVSYYLKVNQFADLTYREFEEMYLTFRPSIVKSDGLFELEDQKVPDSIDWREKGAVLEVKDQGHCQSCWAFSVTGALEGQNAIVFNKTVSLSEQQLMDCNSLRYGCLGGEMKDIYGDFRSKPLFTEESYPYKAIEGACKKDAVSAGVSIKSYLDIEHEEEKLKNVVGTRGPVTIGINGNYIKHYGGGIFDFSDCTPSLNHAVLAVGYGTKGTQDYWIVKNSWGTIWGDKGYIYMSRNKNQQCGLGSYSVIPTIEKSE